MLARAVELSKNDGYPRARARDHEEKQIHHRARDADGGELRLARKAPEDERVDRVVELLQNITHDERRGQSQQMLRNAAAGQIVRACHRLPPSFRI